MNHHDISTTKAKGLGVKLLSQDKIFHGSLQQTNGSLDLAIMGEGFFVLGNPIGRDTDDPDLSFLMGWLFPIRDSEI